MEDGLNLLGKPVKRKEPGAESLLRFVGFDPERPPEGEKTPAGLVVDAELAEAMGRLSKC